MPSTRYLPVYVSSRSPYRRPSWRVVLNHWLRGGQARQSLAACVFVLSIALVTFALLNANTTYSTALVNNAIPRDEPAGALGEALPQTEWNDAGQAIQATHHADQTSNLASGGEAGEHLHDVTHISSSSLGGVRIWHCLCSGPDARFCALPKHATAARHTGSCCYVYRRVIIRNPWFQLNALRSKLGACNYLHPLPSLNEMLAHHLREGAKSLHAMQEYAFKMIAPNSLTIQEAGSCPGLHPVPPVNLKPLDQRFNFLLILGAQKAGTTWLFDALATHPLFVGAHHGYKYASSSPGTPRSSPGLRPQQQRHA